MANIIESTKACSVYPLKLSQPLGAVYAFLGVKHSIPIMHGSQGCAAFAKTFLTRNFSENIPMQTTALSEIATVMGGDDNIHTAIKNVIEKNKPELIGIVSTGVSETRGDDTIGSIIRFKTIYQDYIYKNIAFVSTPDYEGSFHDGYQKALLSILRTLVDPLPTNKINQVNVIISYSITAKDIDILKEIIENFGLKPLIFPDFSSIDGSTIGFSSLTSAGISVEDIRTMSSSMATIAIGESTIKASEYLEKEFNIPTFYFKSLIGLENFDEFIKLLMDISGNKPKDIVKRWRNRLLDAMIDGHYYLTGKNAIVAGEPDTVYAISDYLTKEIGMEIPIALSTTRSNHLKSLLVKKIIIGDLEDILLSKEDVDILIGNTNLRHIANKTKIPHYRIGMPIFDKLGHFLKGYIGYEGTASLVFELANLLIEKDEDASYKIPKFLERSENYAKNSLCH